jgi:predicted acetyltransferase
MPAMATHLVLRPVRVSDEQAVLAAQRTLEAEGFNFAVGLADMRWPDYVAFLETARHASELPAPWVPSTFLLAEVDGTLVGRTSIRHHLTDRLLLIGGHIGYAVLPPYRRRGYATEILDQSLVIAHSLGITPVLVTCDEGNEPSARTIERCGGSLENVVDNPEGGPPKRRYWID